MREELAGHSAQPTTIWPLDACIAHPYFAEKFLLHFPAPIAMQRGVIDQD